MNCRDIESLILAERDGMLTKDQSAALSDHVATCPDCRKIQGDLSAALAAYKASIAGVQIPNADEAWRELKIRLHAPAKKSPVGPVICLGAVLAAAAAFALALLAFRPADLGTSNELAQSAPPAPLHDPSIIAGADFVEAGDPNASTLVYVDKESGWLVVWASDPAADTRG